MSKSIECGICLDGHDINIPSIILNCNHFYHKQCIYNWVKKCKKDITCPTCKRITSITRYDIEIYEINELIKYHDICNIFDILNTFMTKNCIKIYKYGDEFALYIYKLLKYNNEYVKYEDITIYYSENIVLPKSSLHDNYLIKLCETSEVSTKDIHKKLYKYNIYIINDNINGNVLNDFTFLHSINIYHISKPMNIGFSFGPSEDKSSENPNIYTKLIESFKIDCIKLLLTYNNTHNKLTFIINSEFYIDSYNLKEDELDDKIIDKIEKYRSMGFNCVNPPEIQQKLQSIDVSETV